MKTANTVATHYEIKTAISFFDEEKNVNDVTTEKVFSILLTAMTANESEIHKTVIDVLMSGHLILYFLQKTVTIAAIASISKTARDALIASAA